MKKLPWNLNFVAYCKRCGDFTYHKVFSSYGDREEIYCGNHDKNGCFRKKYWFFGPCVMGVWKISRPITGEERKTLYG